MRDGLNSYFGLFSSIFFTEKEQKTTKFRNPKFAELPEIQKESKNTPFGTSCPSTTTLGRDFRSKKKYSKKIPTRFPDRYAGIKILQKRKFTDFGFGPRDEMSYLY